MVDRTGYTCAKHITVVELNGGAAAQPQGEAVILKVAGHGNPTFRDRPVGRVGNWLEPTAPSEEAA
jgi:hypothetical protein